MGFTESQKSLLRRLWASECIVIGDVIREKFGLGSPIYIDLREKLYARPDLLWAIGGALVDKIRQVSNPSSPQCVIGIPDTATPLALTAYLCAWQRRLRPQMSFILLRKKPRVYPHGKESHIIGSCCGPCEYNLIDDVMASGLSKHNSILQLKKENIDVTRIVVLFDRQQGGAEIMLREGYQVHSVFKLLEAVDFYLQEGLITERDREKVRLFIETHRFESLQQLAADR